MATQTYGSPFVPLGSGQWIGAGAAITLNTAPTNAAGFGKTLAQIEATLNATPDGSGRTRKVTKLRYSLEGGTAHILTAGSTPTATIGVAAFEGSYEREGDAAFITGFSAYLPLGVTLNVEYGE